MLLGSLIFSFVNAIQLWLQVLGCAHSFRYCGDAALSLTIVVLVLSAQRVRAPAALSKPYERGH
ncbi:MAG: hypothetical protein R2865_09630 [Deinococcales bacterium]